MSDFNGWFFALPKERQEVLREDKWMLANAAFEHALAERDALAARCLALESAGELMASDLVNSTEFFSLQSITAFNGAKELPTQHRLAAHDAEVSAKAKKEGSDDFIAFLYSVNVNNETQVSRWADQYAAQLRAKVVK